MLGFGVLVGGTGVLVGLGVLVGGMGVLLGISVAVGGNAVLVAVGGSGVLLAVGVAEASGVALGGGRVKVAVAVGSGTFTPESNWKLLRICIASAWATCAASLFRSTLASNRRRLAL